jgi:hypothetical protein
MGMKILKFHHVSLILLGFVAGSFFPSCKPDSDNDNKSICAPQGSIYKIVLEKERCFADEWIIEECMIINTINANNTFSTYCKDIEDGYLILSFENVASIDEAGWGSCPDWFSWLSETPQEYDSSPCLKRDSINYGCASDEEVYLLEELESSCIAKKVTLDECVLIDQDGIDEEQTQYCKETNEGTLILQQPSFNVLMESTWSSCNLWVNLSQDPQCTNCCLIEE